MEALEETDSLISSNKTCEYNDTYNKIVADTFVTACSPFTILFNSFVIYLAVKYVNLNQSFEQWYVISMTAADLLIGLFYMTTIKMNKFIPWYFCRLYYIVIWSINEASVMFLLLLNLHKVVILFFPIFSFAYMSKGKVISQVVICWSLVVVTSVWFAMEPTLTFESTECGSCTVRMDPKIYFIIISCFFILPLITSLALSVLIFGFAQRRSIRRTNQEAPDKERKKMFGRIFFVFTSTIWTSVMFLPYRISFSRILLCRHLLSSETPESECSTSVTSSDDVISYNFSTNDSLIPDDPDPCTKYPIDLLQCVFLSMVAIGTVFNPVITIFTQKAYRHGISDFWNRITGFLHTTSRNDVNNVNRKNVVKIPSCSYNAINGVDL